MKGIDMSGGEVRETNPGAGYISVEKRGRAGAKAKTDNLHYRK